MVPIYDPVGGAVVGYRPAGGEGGQLPGNTSGIAAVNDLTAQAKGQAKDAIAAAIPDNYGAVLRELARSRTQMMIRDTNGIRGSESGAGTSIGQLLPGSAPTSRISAPSTANALQPFRTAINNRVRLL
jgi:hypothetical protein